MSLITGGYRDAFNKTMIECSSSPKGSKGQSGDYDHTKMTITLYANFLKREMGPGYSPTEYQHKIAGLLVHEYAHAAWASEFVPLT